MDYRTHVRAIRALADGPEAFWAAVHDTPDFDGRSFGDFVSPSRSRTSLLQW